MKQARSFTLLFAITLISLHQSTAQTTLKAYGLDRSALSGIGLEKVVLKDEPEREFFQKRLIRGNDISVFIVSSESWITRMDNFGIDEVVYMLNGKANIKPDNGNTNSFYSNEFFFIPKGYTGSWQIEANTNYHYELSIITTQRTESSDKNQSVPQLYDRDALSGTSINLDASGNYEQVLTRGLELTVKLKAQKPMTISLAEPERERLFHLLSGQVVIKNSLGEVQTFYTGDFFMLPEGFTGNWKSEGHGLVKYITFEKTTI